MYKIRFQVSGFGCQVQRPNSTRCVGVAHEMDFLSPLLVFSCNQISVQEPVFTETLYETTPKWHGFLDD